MTDDRLYQAMRLSDQGVAALINGETNVAMRQMRQALQSLDNAYDKKDDEMSSEQESCPLQFYPTKIPVPNLHEDVYYIHNSALLFDAKPNCIYSTSAVAGIIVFNLSLVFHERGFVTKQQCLLEKALNLYHHCHDLLISEDAGLCSGSLHFILIALYNNLAHIAKLMGQHLEAEELLGQAQDIMHFSYNGVCEVFSSRSSSCDIDLELNEILINVILGMAHPAASAA